MLRNLAPWISSISNSCLLTALAGANPSAEGEDAEEGGEGETQRVLDIEDAFRLKKLEGKPSKKMFQTDIKSALALPFRRFKPLTWV